MTKNTTWIISGGTNYYLTGAKTQYSGSGTPWTAEATTPYDIAQNTVVGPIWVPQQAQATMQYLGGAPFALGGRPLYRSYKNVDETLVVQMRATSKNNAITLLRQLNRILNTALYTTPAVLAVTGGTNTSYYEIYQANCQEDSLYLYEATGGVFRATLTWTRSPTGGLLSTGETLVNATTLNNRGSGSPDNDTAYSTGSGDFVNEGSPLNMVITGNNSSGLTYGGGSPFYVASILNNDYTANTDTVTTSSTSGVLCGTRSTYDLSSLLANQGVRVRLCIETTMRDNSSYQARCYFGTGTSGALVYTSRWINNIGNGVNGFLDMGYLPNDVVRRTKGFTAPNLYTQIYVRSNGGASQTYTMQGFQFITYYDWARLDFGTNVNYQGNQVLQIDSFPEQTNAVCLPYIPRAWVQSSSTAPKTSAPVRGTAPRYFSGSRLYFATVRTDGTYNGSDNWTFTVTHAPQYRTLRGTG